MVLWVDEEQRAVYLRSETTLEAGVDHRLNPEEVVAIRKALFPLTIAENDSFRKALDEIETVVAHVGRMTRW